MAFVAFPQTRTFIVRSNNDHKSRTSLRHVGSIQAILSNGLYKTQATFDINAFSKLLYESQQSLCTRIEEVEGNATFCVNPWTSDTGEGKTRGTQDSVWGGGGVDLTIFYVDRPQIKRFHRFWKGVCDQFDPTLYPQFKRQCDEYFYIPSRGEHRGVGGLFYNDIALPEDDMIQFQTEMLKQFFNSYCPILESQRGRPWTQDEKRWQRIRRGRYLEFNLLNDRGVRFGLSGANLDMDHIDDPPSRAKVARTESIMISAPPSIEWPFDYSPAPGSREEETLKLLQGRPVDWVNMPSE